MKILIVDDEPANLHLLRRILEGAGHTVSEACDGVQALTILADQDQDAIISDVMMPRMDGFRLCAEVRRSARLNHIPFIVFTAIYNSAADEKLCYELGVDRYLRKPSKPAVILETLRELQAKPRSSPVVAGALPTDTFVMKQYSEQLVLQLEEKNRQLLETLERLEEKEQNLLRLEQSVEEMLEGMQVIDAHWRYVYVNGAAARQGRSTPEKLLGRTMSECYPGIEDTALFATMRSVMERRLPCVIQNQFTYEDGSNGWFELSIQPDASGILIRSVDISSQKRAELALQNSEKNYRRLFEASADGLLIVDAAAGRVVDVNPCLVDLLGECADEFLGKSVSEIEALRNVFRDDRELTSIPPGGIVRLEDVTLFTRSGREIQAEVVLNLYDVSGRQIVQCNIRDLSGRKRTEALLRERAVELERFQRLSVGRELRMIELKREVNEFARLAGYRPPYDVSFADGRVSEVLRESP